MVKPFGNLYFSYAIPIFPASGTDFSTNTGCARMEEKKTQMRADVNAKYFFMGVIFMVANIEIFLVRYSRTHPDLRSPLSFLKRGDGGEFFILLGTIMK